MVPRTVLTRSGPILVNTARPVNTVQPRTAVNNAGPMKNVINNAYSTARRPFNKITAANNSNFTKKVNTVKGTKVNTARPKVVISVVKGNKGNDVKASPCWGNPQQDLKNKGVIDSGCSRHMTGNRSYLTDYEEIDGGFIAFGGNSKGGKITGKDFKLTDESHALLKVPRKDNMYSVDLKNVIPQGGLTCLFAKATPDESNFWHRRLGQFSENTPNIAGSGPNWLFDIDALTNSMNYKPVVAGNQSNGNAGTKACNDAGKARMETVPGKDYILLPMWPADPLFSQDSKSSPDAGFKPSGEEEKKDAEDPGNESGNPTEGKDSEVPSTEEPRINQEKDDNINSTNNINTASDGNNTNNVNAVSSTVNAAGSEMVVRGYMNNLDSFMLMSYAIHIQKGMDSVGLPNGNGLLGTEMFYRTRKMKEMDVKSAFLYGYELKRKFYLVNHQDLKEPSYLPEYNKVEKALYGLHQAPRA
ncbi:hypothetical protein Tco_1113014 [Tanacetum coccineum]|uniref:Retrovirus-related Pol polyprotein from transposon TNT 1-94-like beta-barrel domain-containing protein n=1 Tax=Tanacetum coccineum TaxID=301880 RepID=A0ABQ5IS76_9ASTR